MPPRSRRSVLSAGPVVAGCLAGCIGIGSNDSVPAPFQLFNIADETATVDIRVVEGSSEEIAIDETVELDPTESHEYRDFERQAYRFHVSAFGNSLTEEWQVYPDERSQLSADIDRDEIEFNTSKA